MSNDTDQNVLTGLELRLFQLYALFGSPPTTGTSIRTRPSGRSPTTSSTCANSKVAA